MYVAYILEFKTFVRGAVSYELSYQEKVVGYYHHLTPTDTDIKVASGTLLFVKTC